MTATDVPTTDLVFVDPLETTPTWRVGLWAEPGQGKTVAACTAPDPILVVNADRPTAYLYARKHHRLHWEDPATGEHVTDGTPDAVQVAAKVIRETRFQDWNTLQLVFKFIRDNAGTPAAVKTLVVDPMSNIYDYLVAVAPKVTRKDEGQQPDYSWVNEKILSFIKALRPYDVNVVLLAHVKEPKKGATMIGPNFGGPALTEKIMRELDIVAHVTLRQLAPKDPDDESEAPRFVSVGQVQSLGTNLICKDGTNALGGFRRLNLTRWFELASESFAPDDSDLPWSDEPPADVAAQLPTLDDKAAA